MNWPGEYGAVAAARNFVEGTECEAAGRQALVDRVKPEGEIAMHHPGLRLDLADSATDVLNCEGGTLRHRLVGPTKNMYLFCSIEGAELPMTIAAAAVGSSVSAIVDCEMLESATVTEIASEQGRTEIETRPAFRVFKAASGSTWYHMPAEAADELSLATVKR